MRLFIAPDGYVTVYTDEIAEYLLSLVPRYEYGLVLTDPDTDEVVLDLDTSDWN